MTLFFIVIAMLVLLCLAWLMVGLYGSKPTDTDQESVNVTLARERRQALETALAEGAIDQQAYTDELDKLEQDLAADLALDDDHSLNHRGQLPAAVLVCVLLPVAAGALYLRIGDPAAINRNPDQSVVSTETDTPPSLQDLLPQLEQRLASSPDDVQGWRLLGRTYLSMGEFVKARESIETALKLEQDHVPTMTLLAESIAMEQQGNLAGEPMQILQKVQTLDADYEHGVWLLSIARQQSGDHQAALAGFDKLIAGAQDNQQALATIEQMRANSVRALSLPSQDPTVQTQTPSTGTSAKESVVTTLTIDVSIGDQALSSVDPEHTVFVYAKASDGPPMPLAVSRLTVADLPARVELNDTMAMIPTMKLSDFSKVTAGARISASGEAIAQSGDWYHEVEDIVVSDNPEVELLINQLTP
ncbi:MAG: c-type cytochrome biogenesis protein CcmI [Granulosicoccus sp.]|nr:c-type cytochrome biogenesis protein CcmI [Granulosicoccus sp.]